MSDPKPTDPRRSEDLTREEFKKERDDFLKAFFRKGVELTEELVRERDTARQRAFALEEENARLRAQVANNEAIRELLTKIEQLETEKNQVLRRYEEVEAASTRTTESFLEVESELANLANLYIASYQLHSSLDPRGVLQNIKEVLAQFIGAECFAIYALTPEQDLLMPIASEGIPEADVVPIALGEGPVGEAFSSGRLAIPSADPRGGSPAIPAATVPLRLQDRVVGALAIFRTLEQKAAFIHTDHELLKLLSTQAMSALIAARLFSLQGGDVTSQFSSFRDLGM